MLIKAYIDKLTIVHSDLNKSESDVDKLDEDKTKIVPADLKTTL